MKRKSEAKVRPSGRPSKNSQDIFKRGGDSKSEKCHTLKKDNFTTRKKGENPMSTYQNKLS